MSATAANNGDSASANEYEALLAQWGDMQAALAFLLHHPEKTADFPAKVRQCDQWLQELVAQDLDASLYLVFQLASSNGTSYSASHALVCAALCHILSREFALPRNERDSLVRAAFTMNIAMTQLQDELAERSEPITAQHQEAINRHAERGMELLEHAGVEDGLWLGSVAQHHTPRRDRAKEPLKNLTPEERLTHLLASVDRFTAFISPRKSRAGRTPTESMRALLGKNVSRSDEAGFVLVRTIGLCPPGTYVKLDNGDTAIVLRRGESTSFPVVASLLDPAGESYPEPELHYTIHGKRRVITALPFSAVNMGTNHYTMVRMGLMAAGKHLRPSR
ncbi:HD-GYP domain-containing protein [Diaphorobacter aerolatus]|uniref:Phosphodiesterase n=1 Tax=Diaphorobacter aerolatus TaxID=1288495 RepID=A0A7H0GLY3_9BURK|nr:HD domain-containing phosphohydrolase [Diaphorobacter aerolatus]QNP49299.1 phosphodiesterase [Diaphorobacter aerolatus]